MEKTSRIYVSEITVDDINEIIDAINNNKKFGIRIFDDQDDNNVLNMWLEDPDDLKVRTLMFSLQKEDALFLAKSIIAMFESK